jgi:hypothetical protein
MPLWRARAPHQVPPSPVPPTPAPGGGDVYGAYIKSQLDNELARTSGLEARASTVVTTAGTLVTLLFGLVTVVTGTASVTLPGAAHGWLIASVLLLVTAIVLAVAVAVIPLAYGQVSFAEDPAQLWAEAATSASMHVAEAQLKLISIAQRKNARIGWIVLLSGVAELLALTMLAIAVILILR